MDRALHHAALGDVDVALREYDDLARTAGSPQQKIEALRGSASVAIQFGDLARARSAHNDARALWTEHLHASAPAARDSARACIDLMEVELEADDGNATGVLSAAQRALARLEALRAEPAPSIQEVYAESQFDMGCALANVGNLESGYEYMARAEITVSRIRPAAFPLRSWITVEACRLRNRLVMSSKHWQPSSQRLRGLANALEVAYASGSLTGAVSALVGLTEHHAVSGNEDEALRAAQSAVLLAKKHRSERLFTHTAISVVLYLVRTRYWKDALGLLPENKQVGSADTRHRDVITYCAAARAFRMRAFDDAWALAKGETGQKSRYPALALRTRLIAAGAAHELQRKQEARTLIEATVAAAEQQGSAPLLREAYSVAAKITGDPRFKQQASEIARLISA
ncbi:MAG TPA: hypothetical protein VMF61_06530 [Candidatus Acidoferrales bacterium]|nr:hypothetical protein [Candidatus Acidoferrales bacterium]